MSDAEIARRYLAGDLAKSIAPIACLHESLKRSGIKPHRRQRILGTEREQELVQRYLAGEPVKTIGNGRTLALVLARNGIKRERRVAISAEREREIVDKYLSGEPIRNLDESRGSLSRVLKRNGIVRARLPRSKEL